MSNTIAPSRAARPPIETHLKRFDKSHRKRLRKLAKTSPRLGDLLYSFPGAAFALVSGHGPAATRGTAVKLVKEGAPLQAVASALRLPLWMRRAPPEAFRHPLPDPLASGAQFEAKIAKLLPHAPEAAGPWLELTLAALALGGDEFGLWMAGQRSLRRPKDPALLGGQPHVSPRLIALYYWASRQEDLLAARFIDMRWHRNMQLGFAVHETRRWLERVIHEYCRGPEARQGLWRKPQRVAGFSIAPRTTAEELEAEGRVMANCVGTYADAVAKGRCLIYAIRRGGKSVATLEIAPDRMNPGRGRIAQLEGYGNGPPPPKVERAVRSWLARQGPCPLTDGGLRNARIDPARWEKVWSPVVAGRADRISGPDVQKLAAIDAELSALTRVAHC